MAEAAINVPGIIDADTVAMIDDRSLFSVSCTQVGVNISDNRLVVRFLAKGQVPS